VGVLCQSAWGYCVSRGGGTASVGVGVLCQSGRGYCVSGCGCTVSVGVGVLRQTVCGSSFITGIFVLNV